MAIVVLLREKVDWSLYVCTAADVSNLAHFLSNAATCPAAVTAQETNCGLATQCCCDLQLHCEEERHCVWIERFSI